jgi:hypothetical protein
MLPMRVLIETPRDGRRSLLCFLSGLFFYNRVFYNRGVSVDLIGDHRVRAAEVVVEPHFANVARIGSSWPVLSAIDLTTRVTPWPLLRRPVIRTDSRNMSGRLSLHS